MAFHKGKRHNEDEQPHGIRIPGALLDEMRKSASIEDKTDARYVLGAGMDKKRKVGLSRKEQRKQDRQNKKKASNQKNRQHVQAQKMSKERNGKNVKQKVTHEEANEESDVSFDNFSGFDDELQEEESDEDIDALEGGDSDNYDDFNNYESESSFDEDDNDEDQPQTAEDTMAALMALKAKKSGKSSKPSNAEETLALLKAKKEVKKPQPTSAEETMALLKAKKEAKTTKAAEVTTALKMEKKKSKVKSKKEPEPESKRFISEEDRRLMERDEEDINYYAKKLGLKSNKLSDMRSRTDDDGLDGLLDGLDFLDDYGVGEGDASNDYPQGDFEEGFDDLSGSEGSFDDDDGQDEEEEGGEEGSTDEEETGEVIDNPFSSDDEINSSDFDSDLEGEDFEDEDGEEPHGETIMAAPKENPYAPAIASSTAPAGKYIPPALRKRLETEESAQLQAIKKSIKGPLNKLSEANVMTIVNQINDVFSGNARQLVTESLVSVILESIVQQATLLDTFVILHAALIAAIYRLQGVEVGAYFVQTLVEKYEEYYKDGKLKEAGNLVSLLTACYSFQVVSSKLLYNLVTALIEDFSEINIELLLRIVKNAGQQLRTDDPNSLKEIILTLTKKVTGNKLNARTKFLVEAITNLKNNRSKSSQNEVVNQLITRMKKVLGSINNNKFHEPLQVTLDDIHSVSTKGKWWLVGSAWKGNLAPDPTEVQVNEDQLNDILDSAEPNWMELARSQRMNTDIRRAIFISIMSSQDYVDAFTKLDKLRLKRSQEREIPKILLHCVSIEQVYNPYYGLLANKLCSSHSLRKTLQFAFWDFMSEIEGEEEADSDDEADYFKGITKDMLSEKDDDAQLQRIVNLAKFFGNLMGEGSLPLHSLKNVNFVSMNSDTSLFVEVLIISFLDNIGKKSEIAAFGQGLKKKNKAEDLKFQDKILVDILARCKTQTQLLRGIQYFLQEKVRASDIIAGKKQRKRVEWGVDCMCDVCDEFLKSMD